MDTRLRQSLEREAQDATDPVIWARAMSRQAVLCARLGDLKAAGEIIRRVRGALGPNLHSEVASWVMLAEGVLHHFRQEHDEAADRLQRAYLLAVAFRTESARPACAAWMALIELEHSRWEEMAMHLREVLISARADDHHALGRASLVMAVAWHLAGDEPRARPWYERARRHALAEGDEAQLGAVLFDVAVVRTSVLRLAHVFDELSDGELLRAAMEADSSKTFDFALGAAPLESFKQLLDAHLRVIEGRHDEAEQLFACIDLAKVRRRDIAQMAADRAFNATRRNDRATAEHWLKVADDRLAQLTDEDDRAFTLGRMATAMARLGRDGAEAVAERARHALAEHRAVQRKLLGLLAAAEAELPPK